MNKEQIVDYVMNTPNNTNRMILGQMLDDLGGGKMEKPIVFTAFFHYNEEDDGDYYDEEAEWLQVDGQSFEESQSKIDKIIKEIVEDYIPNTFLKFQYESDGSIVTNIYTLNHWDARYLYFMHSTGRSTPSIARVDYLNGIAYSR